MKVGVPKLLKCGVGSIALPSAILTDQGKREELCHERLVPLLFQIHQQTFHYRHIIQDFNSNLIVNWFEKAAFFLSAVAKRKFIFSSQLFFFPSG
jgi:hypothetical protein